MATYNKDKEYTLKVVNTDNEIKEIKYIPDKDMSKPQLIMALKSKYKNFFKLIESMGEYNNMTNSYDRDRLNIIDNELRTRYHDQSDMLEETVIRYAVHKDGNVVDGFDGDSYFSDYNQAIDTAKELNADDVEMYVYKNEIDANNRDVPNNTRYVWKNDKKLEIESYTEDKYSLVDYASTKTEFKGFTKEIFKYIEQNLTKEFGDEWYKNSLIDLEDAVYDIVEQYCTRVIDDDSINPTDFYKVVLGYIKRKEDMKVESMEKFDTLVIDNTGNSMLLKGASYNNACYWLEQKLAKEDDKVASTSTDTVNPNITVIRTAKNKKFQYDESDGTLRLLEEYNLTEATKMLKFKLLPTSLQKDIWNIEEMYQEDKLNSDDDVFEDTEDEYADEMLQQHIFDLFDTDAMRLYIYENYDTTTRDMSNKVANLVANKIYNAILDENTESLFDKNSREPEESESDPYEFIANVDALYDKYGETKLPSGCTIQLSLGNKYLFSDEYHDGKEPVCCNGEHCRLMWVYNGVYGVNNLHFNDCSFELTKEEFLVLSSFSVPLDESKNVDNKVKSIVDSATKDIEKGNKKDYNYSKSLRFVIYRDEEYDDIYQIYTYLDDKVLDYLDTGDVHINDMYDTLSKIVKEVHKELRETVNMIFESREQDESVIVINYGKGTRFPDRKTAIEFYKECVAGTDPNGSENYTYQNILWNLENTTNDVVYDTEDETEYNWWVSKGKPVEDISQELLNAHLLEGNGDNNDTFVGKSLNSLLATLGKDGYDISDFDYDVAVFFPYIENIEDNYDEFIKQLGDELIIKEDYKDGDTTIIVGLRDYVNSHKDKLLSIFDIDDTMDDYDMEEYLVCEAMPAIISGNTTDSAYNDLIKGV